MENIGGQLEVKKRANSLVSVQRTTALRIVSAYRTVSAPDVLVTAGTTPVDLLAAKMNYCVTQLLLGYGYFRKYLQRMGN